MLVMAERAVESHLEWLTCCMQTQLGIRVHLGMGLIRLNFLSTPMAPCEKAAVGSSVGGYQRVQPEP